MIHRPVRETLYFFLSVAALAPPNAFAADQLEIVVRAFIPKTHSSTRSIPNGGGDTMVEPPGSSIVGCFETDQRGFTTETSASSRLASFATIQLAAPYQLAQNHPTFESNAIDCGDGKVINEAKTSNEDQRFEVSSTSNGVLKIAYQGSGSNPNFQWAPAIDIEGTFEINVAKRTVSFEGEVDQYPAYEAYVRFNKNQWVSVVTEMPANGKTALDLAFSKDVKKTVAY